MDCVGCLEAVAGAQSRGPLDDVRGDLDNFESRRSEESVIVREELLVVIPDRTDSALQTRQTRSDQSGIGVGPVLLQPGNDRAVEWARSFGQIDYGARIKIDAAHRSPQDARSS